MNHYDTWLAGCPVKSPKVETLRTDPREAFAHNVKRLGTYPETIKGAAMRETLRGITREMALIFEEIGEAGGVLEPHIEADLDCIQARFSVKAEAIVHWARKKKASADGLKVLGEKYLAAAKTRRKGAERMLEYLLGHMRDLGKQEVETETWTLKRARIGKPALTEVGEATSYPRQARRFIPERWELDKVKALELLKDAGRVPSEIGTHTVDFPGGGKVVVEVKERLSVT